MNVEELRNGNVNILLKRCHWTRIPYTKIHNGHNVQVKYYFYVELIREYN